MAVNNCKKSTTSAAQINGMTPPPVRSIQADHTSCIDPPKKLSHKIGVIHPADRNNAVKEPYATLPITISMDTLNATADSGLIAMSGARNQTLPEAVKVNINFNASDT